MSVSVEGMVLSKGRCDNDRPTLTGLSFEGMELSCNGDSMLFSLPRHQGSSLIQTSTNRTTMKTPRRKHEHVCAYCGFRSAKRNEVWAHMDTCEKKKLSPDQHYSATLEKKKGQTP